MHRYHLRKVIYLVFAFENVHNHSIQSLSIIQSFSLYASQTLGIGMRVNKVLVASSFPVALLPLSMPAMPDFEIRKLSKALTHSRTLHSLLLLPVTHSHLKAGIEGETREVRALLPHKPRSISSFSTIAWVKCLEAVISAGVSCSVLL